MNVFIPAGEFRHFVMIRGISETPNDENSLDQQYDAGRAAFAQITPIGNGIFYETVQTDDSVTHRILVNRRPDLTEVSVTANHVVEYEGLRYRISRVSDYKGARRYVMMECECLGVIDG